MIEVAQKYIEAGLSVIPCRQDKTPIVETWGPQTFPPESFRGVPCIGLIGGDCSGGLEVLDFDNKFKDAKDMFSRFLVDPLVKELYDKYKFPIETTQSGGYHLFYRCSNPLNNKKLARRENDQKDVVTLIETKGEGGYVLVDPSPGYKIIRNDILNIPIISGIERNILYEVAMTFNEFFPKPINSVHEGKDRPGDLYNQKDESIEEAKMLLKEAGWTELNNCNWRRPNKKDGTSATFGKVAPNIFYVFSSSAYPFEQERAYTPFQILALLKFNGDFNETAKSLPKPPTDHPIKKEWVDRKAKELDEDTMQKFLTNAFIDTTKRVEHPPVILSVFEEEGTRYVEKRLFTLGNFSCVIGKAKSKKTFFMTMITAALLKNGLLQESIQGNLEENKRKILYFDTEQGEYDSHNTIKRIISLAETPSNLYAFNLRPFSPNERCQLIEYAFKHWGDNVGFCVIDGIADLANAINDEDEATRVATMLLRLTKTYNCHISTVIHQNKNDNFATGHLGSAIMKKAEILISVTKDVTDPKRSYVSCDMSRAIDFSDFAFDIDYNGHPQIKRVPKPKFVKSFHDTEKDDITF